MSTRCNVLVKDSYQKQWFYRHGDGYPSCTAESLKRFLRWVIDGRVRANVGQASGWLVLIGAAEYQTVGPELFPEAHVKPSYNQDQAKVDAALEGWQPPDWQCGAYEPTDGEHGDIEYLYVIDLNAKTIACHEAGRSKPFHVIGKGNLDEKVPGP